MKDSISFQTYSKYPLLRETSFSDAVETYVHIDRFSIVDVNDNYTYVLHRHTTLELMFAVDGYYTCSLNGKNFSIEPGCGIFIQPGDIHGDHCGKGSRFVALVFSVHDSIGNTYTNFLRSGVSEEKRLFRFDGSRDIGLIFELAINNRSGNDVFFQQTAASLATALVWKVFSLLKEDLTDSITDVLNAHFFRSRIAELFFAHTDTTLSVQKMADILAMSRRSLEYKFNSLFGESPSRAFMSYKIKRAIRLLQTGMPSKAVAEELGFANQFHFSRVFKLHTGSSASSFCVKR